jgi:hypothetical protein
MLDLARRDPDSRERESNITAWHDISPAAVPRVSGYHSSVHRRGILVVFAFVVAAAAVSSVSDPAGARVASAGVQVQLLDPGASPRSVLRLTPNTTPASRTLTFSSEITQSGVSSATVGPLQIRTVISTTTGTAGPGGTTRVQYTYGSFQLLDTSTGTPQQLDAMRTSLAQFQGFGGEYTFSSTGVVLSNRFEIPSAVNSTVRSVLEQLSSQSDQLSVPLPTKAVGVGARWRGTTQLTVAGINLRQTYEYKLRSRDRGRLALDVHYTQVAAPQHVSSPGLTPGVSVDVTSYHVAGKGATVLDLSQVIPVSGHVAAQGVQEFRVRQGGRSGKLDQHVLAGIDVTAA